MTDPYLIATVEQLREVIPEPSGGVEVKVFDHVDAFARAFIERSPLVLVATAGKESDLDVSPKGDAPGFVSVEDANTLLIPERPGNKLAYGFQNLLENPPIGLIFVIPSVTETLRVNGHAEITRDPEILERLSAGNKPALLATRVTVEESFFHCGKAFIRSKLWKPDTWPQGVKANLGKQIAAKLKADDALAKTIDDSIQANYETELY
jgi:PPOX class probable FMN-dependent enzyme